MLFVPERRRSRPSTRRDPQRAERAMKHRPLTNHIDPWGLGTSVRAASYRISALVESWRPQQHLPNSGGSNARRKVQTDERNGR